MKKTIEGVAITFGITSKIINPSELLTTTGRILTSANENDFLNQFKKEFELIKESVGIEAKRVDDDYPKSIFSSILKELDKNPDERSKLKLMKKLYLKSVTSSKISSDDLLTHQLTQKVKGMSSMDIVLLECIYRTFIKDEFEYRDIIDRGDWQRIITEELGWSPAMNYLVNESDYNLTKIGILTDGAGNDKNIITGHTNFRLTDLGLKLCEYAYL